MVRHISNMNNSPFSSPPSEIDSLMSRIDYFLRFLDPSSRAPGLLGMISWASLREGLEDIQDKLIQALRSGHLSQADRDKAYRGLAKIEIALDRIA